MSTSKPVSHAKRKFCESTADKCSRDNKLFMEDISRRVEQPSKASRDVIPSCGGLSFKVPSSSDPSKYHTVMILMKQNGHITLTCSYNSQIGHISRCQMYCRHIDAAYIYFMNRYIESAKSAKSINTLGEDINKLTKRLKASSM